METIDKTSEDGPLSYTEENAWREFKSDRDLFFHRGAVLTVDLPDGAGRAEVQKIMAAVSDRHEIFRTAFDATAGQPRRHILDHHEHKIMEADVAEYPLIGESLTTLLPDDLARCWLIRNPAGPGKQLAIDINEIITDSWSCARLQPQLQELVRANGSASAATLPPADADYAQFALEQRSRDLPSESVDYWRTQLRGMGTPDYLAVDGPDPSGDIAGERVVIFTDDMTAALRELCRELRLSPFMAAIALVKMVMATRSGSRDITVSTTSSGRARKWTEVQGNFSNVLLLRSKLSANPSFGDLLALSRAEVLGALRHQSVPYLQLSELLGMPALESPVRVHYLPHRAHHYRLLDSRPSGDAWVEDAVFSGWPMEIGFAEDKHNRFAIWMSYDPHRYTHANAGQLLQGLCDCLRLVAANPALTCADLRSELNLGS